jgi:hypothetical protein
MCEAEAVKAAPGVSTVFWLLFVSRRAPVAEQALRPCLPHRLSRIDGTSHISPDAHGQAPGGRPGPTYYPKKQGRIYTPGRMYTPPLSSLLPASGKLSAGLLFR